MRRATAASSDKVDNHCLQTFGSAILLAMIGDRHRHGDPGELDARHAGHRVRRRPANFAETFGRVAERTINKNLDVQPTSKSVRATSSTSSSIRTSTICTNEIKLQAKILWWPLDGLLQGRKLSQRLLTSLLLSPISETEKFVAVSKW
jgi:hypothetical protein